MPSQHDQLMKELIAAFPDQFVRLAAPERAERVNLDAVTFEPEEHYPALPADGSAARTSFPALGRRSTKRRPARARC